MLLSFISLNLTSLSQPSRVCSGSEPLSQRITVGAERSAPHHPGNLHHLLCQLRQVYKHTNVHSDTYTHNARTHHNFYQQTGKNLDENFHTMAGRGDEDEHNSNK